MYSDIFFLFLSCFKLSIWILNPVVCLCVGMWCEMPSIWPNLCDVHPLLTWSDLCFLPFFFLLFFQLIIQQKLRKFFFLLLLIQPLITYPFHSTVIVNCTRAEKCCSELAISWKYNLWIECLSTSVRDNGCLLLLYLLALFRKGFIKVTWFLLRSTFMKQQRWWYLEGCPKCYDYKLISYLSWELFCRCPSF